MGKLQAITLLNTNTAQLGEYKKERVTKCKGLVVWGLF